MKTVNSLSGGKTSSYIAAHYPADANVFVLVRTDDKDCIFPDAKIRQIVSDRIGQEFIGTLEMNDIIYTMLDLEQFIGQEIDWISPISFDKAIQRKEDKIWLPNKTMRFCTIEMKIKPIMNWWATKFDKKPVEMRLGFRANEMRRAKSQLERCREDGLQYEKITFEKHKNGNNKWVEVAYRKPTFPLIEDGIFKDTIENYWKDKPVRFAYLNNCVGCFHRTPVLLKHMSNKSPKQFDWFVKQEEHSGNYNNAQFKTGMTYRQIKNGLEQLQLFDDDFSECDSGYCGL